LKTLYKVYNAYSERRRREQAEREAVGRGDRELIAVDTTEALDTQLGMQREGRPPCDIVVLLGIVLYGAMEYIYSSRDLAKACRQNINFMWLLQGNPPPSHGIMNLLALKDEVSCMHCIIYEVRSVRKLFYCGGLHSKPVYYHFCWRCQFPLALKGGVSCKRCIVYEVRSVRKLFYCGGLHSKPVYYHFC
jgi:hypothetical protein